MKTKHWTDADRAKMREYFIVTPRGRKVAQFRADLGLANAIFDMFFATGEYRAIEMFHDKPEHPNLVCAGDIHNGIVS